MQSQREFHGLPPRSDARTRRFSSLDCAVAHSGRALAPGLRQGLQDGFTRRGVRVHTGAADADLRRRPRSGMLFVLSFLCAAVRTASSDRQGPRLFHVSDAPSFSAVRSTKPRSTKPRSTKPRSTKPRSTESDVAPAQWLPTGLMRSVRLSRARHAISFPLSTYVSTDHLAARIL